jgi:hypothetical protein
MGIDWIILGTMIFIVIVIIPDLNNSNNDFK